MKFESIFDGWEKQSRTASDLEGGTCAYTFIRLKNRVAWLEDAPKDVQARFRRIGEWIIKNMDIPCAGSWLSAIVRANDTGQLDIEGFKTVEKLVMGYVPDSQPEEARVGVE